MLSTDAYNIMSSVILGFLIVYPSCIICCMMKKKSHFLVKLIAHIVIALCFTGISASRGYLYINTWWVLALLHIFSVSVLWMCNQCDFMLLIYLKIWSTAFYHLSLQIPGLVATAIDAGDYFRYMGLGGIISLLIITFIIIFVFRNIEKKQIEDMSISELLQAVTIVSLIVILNRFVFTYYLGNDQVPGIVFLFQVFSVFCMILILYMQLEIHYRQMINRESRIKEHIWNLERKHFEQKKEQIDLINRKCHDLKHQIAALQHISDKAVLDKNINELKEAVNVYDEINQTGNVVLGTILAEKKLQYGEYGVTLNYVVDGVSTEFIDTVDLYILLGNALDNAFESLCKVQEKKDKVIKVQIFKDKSFIRITIRNTFDGEIVMEDDLPVSSKEKDGYHGIGIKSMQQIARKYNGELVVEVEQDQFVLKIMMPIP